MFTIDLLKGEGIPAKSKPWGAAVGAVTFAVPVIAATVMLSFYLTNSIAISIEKQRIASYQSRIVVLSDAVRNQKTCQQTKEHLSSHLSEISRTLDKHTQWSPVLTTLVENLPETVVLTKLSVEQRYVKKEIPGDKPDTKVAVRVPARTLRMTVCGRADSDCDLAVRDFGDRLRGSSVLGSRLEEIKVSQEFDTLDGQEVVAYEIYCYLRPGA